MQTTKELQAKVNPIYTTGKGTTGCLAQAGNKDAISIVSRMDFSDVYSGRDRVQEPVRKCYATALEARYEISNEMIRRENKPNVIDLPSGYTPRAFFAAKAGMRYIGFDLPVVADEIGAIIREIMPEELLTGVEYHGVDATNYASMRNALNHVKGEVCIATDGLLAYFNESETVSMCNNIKRILAEFGGSWITGDMTNAAIYVTTFRTLLIKSNPDIFHAFSMNTASQMADVTIEQSSLFNGGPKKALEFLQSFGFQVEKVSYADLMPPLLSMAADPEGEKELREAFRDIEMWKITLAPGASGTAEEVRAEAFSAELYLAGDELRITLGGRLDTITSPELLQKYENLTRDQHFSSVVINLKDLQYISSAGLRVLLMIYKALNNKSNFHMQDVRPEIIEIFETTGFDLFFLK